MVVLLENMDLNDILSNPTFSEVASQGILLSNYHGVAHPSQPNCTFLFESVMTSSSIVDGSAAIATFPLSVFPRAALPLRLGAHVCSRKLPWKHLRR